MSPRDLHHSQDPHPHLLKLSDKDMQEKEKNTKTRVCILSSQAWLDSAMRQSLTALGDIPGMADWAQSLEELRSISSSLSILLMDRAVTDLGKYGSSLRQLTLSLFYPTFRMCDLFAANAVLTRRSMWMQGLAPQPSHQLSLSLQTAPLLSPQLFGGLSDETVQLVRPPPCYWESTLDSLHLTFIIYRTLALCYRRRLSARRTPCCPLSTR